MNDPKLSLNDLKQFLEVARVKSYMDSIELNFNTMISTIDTTVQFGSGVIWKNTERVKVFKLLRYYYSLDSIIATNLQICNDASAARYGVLSFNFSMSEMMNCAGVLTLGHPRWSY